VTEPALAFDKKELRSVIGAFKAMDEQATDEAKKMGYELAQYAAQEVRKAALTRTVNPVAVRRIADGVRVSRTSKVGEFSYGFASQRFSGGDWLLHLSDTPSHSASTSRPMGRSL